MFLIAAANGRVRLQAVRGVLATVAASVLATGVAPASAEQRSAAIGPGHPNTEAAPPVSALARLPIVRRQLDNGLRLVLGPNPGSGTVAVAVYYDVGSRDEVKGRSGFAHLLEHMMFQGSDNVARGEHIALVIGRGGTVNATTSHDRTDYFQVLPSNELELALWLEADRMRSLTITQENLEDQRQAVMEERRRSYEARPYLRSMLKINELAYGDYFPYAHATIGDPRDLEQAGLAHVLEFFGSHYAPNHAVLSICGDFDVAATIELVHRYFGKIQARPGRSLEPAPPVTQNGQRAARMCDPHAALAAFHIAYRIPPSRSNDHYPLELLASVLGGGRSSRLHQLLVRRRELLREIRVKTDKRRGPDLLSFWGVCAEGVSPADVRELIFVQLRKVSRLGVTRRELRKAKNRIRAALVYSMESNLSRSKRLAEYELYAGDAREVGRELERYLAVDLDDVKRVAATYLAAENRSVLDVLPGGCAR
ncbi:MAG: insulinase family protein [Proteobacteria bacterium]|nr:insulinase family protein [Pseudomonadota bacterium]